MLWTVALGGGPLTVTAAVLLTTAFDAVFALRVSERPVRVVALVCAFGTGGWGSWRPVCSVWERPVRAPPPVRRRSSSWRR